MHRQALVEVVEARGRLRAAKGASNAPLLNRPSVSGADDEVIRPRVRRTELPRDEQPPQGGQERNRPRARVRLRRLLRPVGQERPSVRVGTRGGMIFVVVV
jgi:hypothetical protein